MAVKIDTDARIEKVRLQEQGSDPSAPAAGYGYLYEKTDQQIYFVNASGTTPNLYHYGTSFPGSPKTSEHFYRTDRNLMYFYDGTRWLTNQLFSFQYAVTAAISAAVRPVFGPAHGGYDVYITRLQWAASVATTNNGSHYWIAQAQYNETNTWTNFGSAINTSAISVSTWSALSVDINTVVAETDADVFGVNITKNGSPGDLVSTLSLFYRLIG